MPLKRYRRRSTRRPTMYKRKTYRRFYRKRRGYEVNKGPMDAFPDTFLTNFVYEESINFTALSGADGIYQFRGNGPYDPNYTGTGYQPKWFDQMASFYSKYAVKYVDVSVTWYNQGSVPYLLAIQASPEPSAGSLNYDYVSTGANTILGKLGPTGSSKSMMNMKKRFYTNRILACSYKDSGNIATFSSNPANQYYIHLAARTLDLSAVNIYATVRINYFVELSWKKTAGWS